MREINAQQLKQILEQNQDCPFLLDVREPWEFDYCRIENSKLIPMRQVVNVYHELERDRETIVICHHGIRSRQIAYFLEAQGFTNVINLAGGVEAWAQDVEPECGVTNCNYYEGQE